jgi:hypothetical protein
MMTPPSFAITGAIAVTIAVAFMNGNAAFTGTNDDFSGSRKDTQHGRCNGSAQNKQSHFRLLCIPLMKGNAVPAKWFECLSN